MLLSAFLPIVRRFGSKDDDTTVDSGFFVAKAMTSDIASTVSPNLSLSEYVTRTSFVILLREAMYFAKDGGRKLFGEHRVLHDVEKNSHASAIEIIDFLKQHVSVFADGTEQSDDLTMLFLRHGKVQETGIAPSRRLIMKNEMSEVGRLRTFFFSVCREHGINDETAKTLNLALEEWVANVISYAYPKGMRGHVEVTADVTADVLTLVIKDHGYAFDPTQHAEVDIDAELDERSIGGLGIHLMRSIMDNINYERTSDGYNRLVLTKDIKSELI